MGVAGEKGTKEGFRALSGGCFGNKKSQFTTVIGGFGRFHSEIHLSRA